MGGRTLKRLSCVYIHSSKLLSVSHLALILNDILRTVYKSRSLPLQTPLLISVLISFFQSFNLFFFSFLFRLRTRISEDNYFYFLGWCYSVLALFFTNGADLVVSLCTISVSFSDQKLILSSLFIPTPGKDMSNLENQFSIWPFNQDQIPTKSTFSHYWRCA